MSLKHGSLFSGIGGFDLGFEKAGFTTSWQVEIEEFPCRVLTSRFPHAKRFKDIKNCGIHNLERVDVITAGVPCQDVSVAGKRAGLVGERTGLFYEFARILCELRPTWFVFENVPGLFSSNRGRDFAEVLRVLMVECRYGIAWRVLDSQYFGVAQRRERVFIVGRAGGDAGSSCKVLFEPESGKRNPAEGREAGKDITCQIAGGAYGTGRASEDDPNLVCNNVSRTLANSGVSSGYRYDPNGEEYVVANTLRESDGHHGRSSPRGDGCDNVVAAAIRHDTDHEQRESLQSSTGRSVPSSVSERASTIGNVAAPLSAGSFDKSHQPGRRREDDFNLAVAYTLGSNERNKSQGPSNYVSAEAYSDRGRGITGISERLDYPLLPKGLDSARYRCLGNAVTVSVAYWLAQRMMENHTENR